GIGKGASARSLIEVRGEDGCKIRHVVCHGVTNSESCLAVTEDVPSQSGAGPKIMQVQVIKTGDPFASLDQTLVWEKIGATIAGFTKRPVQIPAQAVADGHARRRLPLILEQQSKRRLVAVACSIAERARSPIQPAKQHLREDNVVAGDRNVIRWVRGRKFVGSLET